MYKIFGVTAFLATTITNAFPLSKRYAISPSYPNSDVQLCAVPGANSVTPCSHSSGQWLSFATLSSRTQLAATALDDGSVYAVGGIGGEDRVDRYDPITGQWTEIAPVPAKRHHLMVEAYPSTEGGPRDSVLIIGGFEGEWDSRKPQTDCYLLHHTGPKAGTYSEFPRLPYPRAAAQAVVVGSDVYVVGGDLSGYESLFFNSKTQQWDVIPSPQQMRMDLGAAYFEGEIYIFGGRWLGVGELDSVEIYNPSSRRWRSGPSMREKRAGMVHGVLNGMIIVAGGDIVLSDEANPRVLSSSEILSPRNVCKSQNEAAKEVVNQGIFYGSAVDLPRADKESVKSIADLTCPTPSGLRRRATNDLGEKWEWKSLPALPQRIHGAGSAVTNGLLLSIGGSVITPLDLTYSYVQAFAPALRTFSKSADRSDADVAGGEAAPLQETFRIDEQEADKDLKSDEDDEDEIGIVTISPEESEPHFQWTV